MVHTFGILGSAYLSYSTSARVIPDTTVKRGNSGISAASPDARRMDDSPPSGISTMSMPRAILQLAAIAATIAMAATASAQGLPTSPGQDPFWKFQPFL